jgi:hypothetical protein
MLNAIQVKGNHRQKSVHILLFIIPLILSAFIHIWNPLGFPAVHVDEGHYMRRAMLIIEGGGPQESEKSYPFPFDHPYFGQLFLAAVLGMIGYPDVLHLEADDPNSIEMLYLIPRVLMGILSVIDTLLVYKIAEYRYNRNVAFIAAVLFAVVPLSTFTRGIFLESILLPLILSSILFALRSSSNGSKLARNSNYLYVILSGIFLGLAIFAKAPVISAVPLVYYLIIRNNGIDRFKTSALWLVPLLLIPLMWPASALSAGNFDKWLEGFSYQLSRETGSPLRISAEQIIKIDPMLLLLATLGLVCLEFKRDFFILLWIGPFLIFLFFIGWVVTHHWIVLVPAFCISAAVFIYQLTEKLKKRFRSFPSFLVIPVVFGFGMTGTASLIFSDLNSTYFELYSFLLQELKHGSEPNHEMTIVGSHRTRALLWIPNYVYGYDNIFFRDTDVYFDDLTSPIKTNRIVMIADSNMIDRIHDDDGGDKNRRIGLIFNKTQTIATFVDRQSRETSLMGIDQNYGFGDFIQVRANYD